MSPKLPTWKVPKMGFLLRPGWELFLEPLPLYSIVEIILFRHDRFWIYPVCSQNSYLNGDSNIFFDVAFPQQAEDLIQPHTKIIYAETPTNPGVDVLDLTYLGDLARSII